MIAYRKSRFHTEKGDRLDWRGAWYAVPAFVSSVMRSVFGLRPARPWISYRATRVLDGLMDGRWRVLEFGSGMSTLWLAPRSAYLHSIESDPQWHSKVKQMLPVDNEERLRYEIRDSEAYPDTSQYPDSYFDLVVVDGIRRDACVESALRVVKPGGFIYLDNSDTDMTLPQGEMRVAEKRLLRAVAARRGSFEYFVDFAPAQFLVNQGLLGKF